MKIIFEWIFRILVSVLLGPIVCYLWNHSLVYTFNIAPLTPFSGMCLVLLLFVIRFVWLLIVNVNDIFKRVEDNAGSNKR